MKIGYARVSTDEQLLDMQLDALQAVKCDQIFKDEGISAIAANRQGWESALQALDDGDTLVIWKLDRAFRSTVDAILTLDNLRDRGIEFQCITMQIDTSTPEGRKWYRDTASWAEYERELISQRTKAGMAAANRRGKHVGRPKALTDEQINHAQSAIAAGETVSGMAGVLNVNRKTLSNALRQHGVRSHA
ncbi:MAG: recombinase family protein [Pseudomonadaceae bacterium]|nr:recombinase family protein [Pseudomonadaceae bacterium]